MEPLDTGASAFGLEPFFRACEHPDAPGVFVGDIPIKKEKSGPGDEWASDHEWPADAEMVPEPAAVPVPDVGLGRDVPAVGLGRDVPV